MPQVVMHELSTHWAQCLLISMHKSMLLQDAIDMVTAPVPHTCSTALIRGGVLASSNRIRHD